MKDAVALITGAKGGLGTTVTQKFLDAGYTVVGTSRSIKQEDFPYPNFVAIPVDFTKVSVVTEMANQVVSQFGKIDVLVHVMGGFAGGKTVAQTDDATWEQMRDLNLTSAFYATRAVLVHMRKAQRGRIIAVGSLAAVEPHVGLGAYVTFKTALNALIRTIALENMDANITANLVLPGTMDTPANRAATPGADPTKWVQPSDVADAILSLAAPPSTHINGAVVPIHENA